MEENYPCPANHSQQCPICKKSDGRPAYAGPSSLIEVDRTTGQKKINHCCEACEKAAKRIQQKYLDPQGVARITGSGGRVPTVDEVLSAQV